MGKTVSVQESSAVRSGHQVRWKHSGVAERVTIAKSSNRNLVLAGIDVNSTTASPIVVTDSVNGMAATLQASIVPGPYLGPMVFEGNIVVDNVGGSDITIRYSND